MGRGREYKIRAEEAQDDLVKFHWPKVVEILDKIKKVAKAGKDQLEIEETDLNTTVVKLLRKEVFTFASSTNSTFIYWPI